MSRAHVEGKKREHGSLAPAIFLNYNDEQRSAKRDSA